MSQQRRPMRLLLREHGSSGGTETVNIHLVEQFTKLVERVVWVMPESRMEFFQKILPPSDRLIYERPSWPRQTRLPYLLQKATSFALRRKNLPARATVHKARQKLSDRWLQRLIRRHQITHCFCTWTFCVDVPRLGIPMGAMIMDVRWKHFPETFPHVDVDMADRQFCDWLRKSSIVFPVSDATASDIRRFYPWHAGTTRVIPHGAEIARPNGSHSPSFGGARNGRCIFFYPAAANGHKDHLTLFRACAKLFRKGFDFELILTGFGTEFFRDNSLQNRCRTTGEAAVEHARAFLDEHEQLFHGRIRPLGYIERGQVDALYQTCSAVILPSFFEGFGLPLIEAVQNGATVICSDIPAHREQLMRYGCNDQVPLVPPTDHDALADEMEKIIMESPRGHPTKRVRPDVLDKWTWRDVAEAYLDSLAAITEVTTRSRKNEMRMLGSAVPVFASSELFDLSSFLF